MCVFVYTYLRVFIYVCVYRVDKCVLVCGLYIHICKVKRVFRCIQCGNVLTKHLNTSTENTTITDNGSTFAYLLLFTYYT